MNFISFSGKLASVAFAGGKIKVTFELDMSAAEKAAMMGPLTSKIMHVTIEDEQLSMDLTEAMENEDMDAEAAQEVEEDAPEEEPEGETFIEDLQDEGFIIDGEEISIDELETVEVA